MAKCIIWCRVSTTEQELESQKEELTKKAIQEGYSLEDLIVIGKEGASAIKMNDLYQREVNQLIETIETQADVKAIFVWEISRLARNDLAFAQMKDKVVSHKIQLICIVPQLRLFDEDENGNTTQINYGAETTLSLLITLARQEMEIKTKRFARGKKRLAEQGKYNGGAIPYGYRIDRENDNRIVVDEGGEADIVREVYNMYENGMSQPKIAKELHQRGYKSRAVKTTKTFTISLVHQLLTNKLLTGQPCKNKGTSYERVYPMIITPEQFERCRKIAEDNNTKANKAKRIYFAHSLIECVNCGRKFVGTGCKGYYHCWDAYYPYRDFNGSEGTPRCTHRVCISTNIMDSLLWELAKDLEANFILHSSQQCLQDCINAKSIIEQKLAAIGGRREEIALQLDRANELYIKGRLTSEKYDRTISVILTEEKEIDAEEANYKEQITKYDRLIQELNTKIGVKFDFDTDEGIDMFLDDVDDVWDRVNSTTDDAVRSDIVHKHIEKVTVEATTINYKFKKYPEGKDVAAKLIKVYPYITKAPQVFYFIPNNGKGGLMLREYADGGKIITIAGMQVEIPKYEEFPMEYLPRIIDTGKKKRREIERTRRENIKSLGTEKLRKEGYITMNEMREDSKLSYSTLYNAIKEGKMKGENMFRTWYVKEKDYRRYLKKYAPKPRPYRQTTSVVSYEELNADPKES